MFYHEELNIEALAATKPNEKKKKKKEHHTTKSTPALCYKSDAL